MNKSFLAGAIRRHESIRALKDRAQEPLPTFIQSSQKRETAVTPQKRETTPTTNVTTLPCLHQAAEELEKKNQQHLQLPTHRRGGFMRVSSIFIFLLLLLVAALFFYGGYLYSYMHLPGTGPGIATAQYAAPAASNWRQPQPIIPGTGTLEAGAAGSSYLQRRQVLQKDQAVAEDVFTQGEDRSKAVAKQQAKEVLTQSTQQMRSVVRNVAGERVARIFDPFATTVVAGTVGAAVDQSLQQPTKPTSSNKQSSTGKPTATATTAPTQTTPQGPSDHNHAMTAGAAAGAGVAGVAAADATQTKTASAQQAIPLYAIEVRTFEDDGTNAWALMNSLHNRGYPEAYVAREFADNHLYFKVRIGHFTSYLDASRARDVLDVPSRVVVVELNENRMIE
jgi:hypothetical protein